jgi:hypothetical protein
LAATHMAEVLEKSESRLKLALYILIPEVDTLYTAKSYLLQVLWDGAQMRPCALLDAMTEENRSDNAWISENAAIFIDGVELVEDRNLPVTDPKVFETLKKAQLPRATYVIDATNQKWVEHLRPSQEWDTVPLDIDGW